MLFLSSHHFLQNEEHLSPPFWKEAQRKTLPICLSLLLLCFLVRLGQNHCYCLAWCLASLFLELHEDSCEHPRASE